MRKYEGVFIFMPNLEEEKRNQDFDKLQEIINKNGSVLEVAEWGMRKLAYEINDLTEGYYFVVNFESNSEVVQEIDRICKISDSIMRHMIVRDDK